jgi:thioredoxin 1
MPHIKNLLPKKGDALYPEKRSASFLMYMLLSAIFLILATGCGSREEKANASAKDKPVTVSPSAETQKTSTSQQQLQTVEADSSISKEAQKLKTKKQSGIKATFVELGSVNCIPCKKMQPIMKEIEEEYKNQVKVVFHDVWTDEGRPYAKKFGIRVIPTQIFLDKNEKEYFRHEGFFPKEQLVEVLKKQGVK